jgi:hypothetical protein
VPSKTDEHGHRVPKTAMPMVRRALAELQDLDLDMWTEDSTPNVGADRSATTVLEPGSDARRLEEQRLIDADVFEVLRPFDLGVARPGPDLVKPRPRVRIVPAGEVTRDA